MKEQTFIVYLRDENGNMKDFERFGCKKLETVKKNMKKLFSNELYRKCIYSDGITSIEIYSTKNIIPGKAQLVYCESLNDFIKDF